MVFSIQYYTLNSVVFIIRCSYCFNCDITTLSVGLKSLFSLLEAMIYMTLLNLFVTESQSQSESDDSNLGLMEVRINFHILSWKV